MSKITSKMNLFRHDLDQQNYVYKTNIQRKYVRHIILNSNPQRFSSQLYWRRIFESRCPFGSMRRVNWLHNAWNRLAAEQITLQISVLSSQPHLYYAREARTASLRPQLQSASTNSPVSVGQTVLSCQTCSRAPSYLTGDRFDKMH